jgi:NTE family protein
LERSRARASGIDELLAHRGRTAVVLGAGALTGGAYEAGVLAALHDHTGFDARDADLIVGTSIGSLVGTMLRWGLSASDLYAYRTTGSVSAAGQAMFTTMGEPPAVANALPRPHWPVPPPRVLMRAVRHPLQARAAFLTAVLPTGRYPTDAFGATLRRLTGTTWPEKTLWTVAAQLPSGKRVIFGADGCPACDVPDAVTASCAVPGYFAPVLIDGRLYVDGGVHSPTNADVVADGGFDTVLVVSPMSSARSVLRTNPVRRYCGVLLGAEVRKLRRAGARVIAFQPGAAEQRAMGFNAFDEARCPAVAQAAYDATIARLGTRVAEAAGEAA